MYSRNYTPLFVVLAIGLLLSIVWLANRPEPSYEISGAAQTLQQQAPRPTSGDPLVTPGPSRMY
ncbi:hypothetical protein HZA86_03255 [Candidatus Uhrbacteria bacterium]|nr:hypothetical protein [Candidatus Uhrbacteria bacterium]